MSAPLAGRCFTVFGAGLSGSLAALTLARSGATVNLYESRPDPRGDDAEGGRSINLALSTRGLWALERVGLADAARDMSIPMRGRMIHSVGGETVYQPYSHDPDDAIRSISRAGLNRLIVSAAADDPNVTVHFERRLEHFDPDAMTATVRTPSGEESVACDPVIGADGAFSRVRDALRVRGRFDFSQDYLPHGYKELSIPPADGGGHRIDANSLHIWPRGKHMLIALPNADGSFTCTLFLPYAHTGDAPGFDDLNDERAIVSFFEKVFPDATELMPTLTEDFFANPTGSLVTVRCAPWALEDKAILVGDAAHAVVPFYGQGMNASFEDIRQLAETIEKTPGDLPSAFGAFAAARKPAADALADLAIHNYLVMRDKTASPLFRFEQALARFLAKLAPSRFKPLYEMVSFSTIPYHEAVARANDQARAVRIFIIAAAAAFVAALLVGLLA